MCAIQNSKSKSDIFRNMAVTKLSELCLVLTTALFILLPNPASATISVVSELTNATLASINDLPARFIPERFSFFGIQGYLVQANPPTACGKLEPPPNPYPPNIEYPINWIVLARRSPDCHFQTKIENAQKAGYIAIIIHNVDSNATEIMGVADASKITIYATFVGEYDGRVLKNYTYPSESYIRIQDDFSINGYLLPFAIVVGLCFIVMIIFMVRLLWQQVLRWIRERRRSRRRKLPTSALKKLPTQKWTKGDPYETCAVCLEDFVEQDKIRVLPCSHGFHMKCIDPWLTKGRRVCPICKRKVIVADERFRDSDSDTDDETAPLLGTSAASNAQPPAGEGTFVQGQGESSVTTESERQQRSRSRRVFSRQPRRPTTDSDSSSMTSVSSQASSTPSSVVGAVGQSASHKSRSVLAEVHHSSEVLRQRVEEIEHNLHARLAKPQDSQSVHSGQSNQEGFSSRDNAMYVPEVEFDDPNANPNAENRRWNQNNYKDDHDALSSPAKLEVLRPTSSTSSNSSADTNVLSSIPNPIV